MSRAEARTLLEPHLPTFKEVFDLAWDHYMRKYDVTLRLDHSRRSRASIVHDLLRRYASERFEGKPGIFLRMIRGLFLVEVAGKLLVRFKKVDRHGKAKNIPTGQANLFYGQQLELPGISSPTGLVAGYKLDRLEQGIEARLITCPVDSTIKWSFAIDEPVKSVLTEPETITPKVPKRKPKVRAKGAAVQQKLMGLDESN